MGCLLGPVMFANLPTLASLPRRNATRRQKDWPGLVRLVRRSGATAITNGEVVEVVLIDAAVYRQLEREILAFKAREQSVLDHMARRFDERLAVLQEPGATRRMRAVFDAKGKPARAPKAGASF